jgi:ATP-dependent Clp protease ATP-binding subunit ClpA
MADRRFGARPLVRVLEKRVVTPLAELINNRVIRAGDHLQARVEKAADGDEELEETIVFFLTSSSKERPLKSHKSGNA